ncbi:hypothetical protein BDV35DRAFT_379417 [Aspergillus flavus]|uniref:Uncharacterized protein n=1 Tax=Aspergillus flavus TaxID=5059 RepID=A0A5N6H0F9_ASPFL|nr:hypothetical protein BDV35DRAFT_379417 [Aspergillus flavus]
MLGFAHKLIVELFKLQIHDKLVALDVEEDVYPSGSFSSRYGDWVKEPDGSWMSALIQGTGRGPRSGHIGNRWKTRRGCTWLAGVPGVICESVYND